MRSIPVEFTGERAGEGPLTLGQLDVYAWVSVAPDHFYAILCVELPVPAVVSVDDVAEAAAVLIARHESLRTSYLPGEQPRQRVAAAGVQLLEVFSLGEGQWGPRDRPAVAEALIQWLRESPDPTLRPVRMAVAVAPGTGDRVIACAAGFTHLAVDHSAIEILKRDFAGLLGDPARRQAAAARAPAAGPGRDWRRRRPGDAGPARHWTACGSSRGGSPAACTRCRAPGPAASRWPWSCRRWPPRWPCGGRPRAPGPAGPAS